MDAYRISSERERLGRMALRQTIRQRIADSRELSEAMKEAGIHEVEGFEHMGMVAWYQDSPSVMIKHIFLAFYRRS